MGKHNTLGIICTKLRTISLNGWTATIKSLLFSLGLNCVWYDQGVVNVKLFVHVLKQSLQDNHITEWNRAVSNSNDGILYRTYKLKPFYSQFINSISKLCYQYYFENLSQKITIYPFSVVNGFHLNLIMNVSVAHVKFWETNIIFFSNALIPLSNRSRIFTNRLPESIRGKSLKLTRTMCMVCGNSD